MIHINLIGRDDQFEDFCKKCQSYFGKVRNCEYGCPGCALRYCQKRCNEGISLARAYDEWTKTNIPKARREEIVADAIGVDDIEELRAVIKGDE